MRAVDLTVDILAEEQGLQVATLLVKERKGKLSAAEGSGFIEPALLTRSPTGARWLDTLFDDGATTTVRSNEPALATPDGGTIHLVARGDAIDDAEKVLDAD